MLAHHLRGLIDICGRDGSITDQSAVIQKQDVMFGVVPSPLAAVAQRLDGQQWLKKKKREKRKAQKSVLQRRCGAFGAFLENLNSVSSTCAFGFFFFSLCCSQGLGFRRGARAFSMSETVLLCRRSVRVCAASATIRVRDG